VQVDIFKQKPVLGILRGVKSEAIEPLIETVIGSGLETLEITMNTPQAAQLISKAMRSAAKRLTLGAGTVLTLDDLKSAQDSGASFFVLPVLVMEVVEYCLKHNLPVFPGALTPDEIYRAHQAGATMVKVFPAKFFGPRYLKEIKGPFREIQLLACGGVDAGNLADYFDCGASAVTFGASIFRQEWLEAKDFKIIGQAISDFICAWQRWANKR